MAQSRSCMPLMFVNVFALTRRTPGTYANLVKQAKSKQKILDKMYEAGLTPPVSKESTFSFQFPGELEPTIER